MKTLKDLRNYAIDKGMCDYDIERLIDSTDTDENGNVIDFEQICFGIDCVTE